MTDGESVPERVPRAHEAHEESAEEAAAALADAEEERAHDAHHARHRRRRRDLGHVGHGRGHHERHRQALQRLERVDVVVDGLLQERVAKHPDEVGDHAQHDDVDVADQVGDGAGEDEEGEAGDHAHGHGPPHDEAAGVEVVEVPEEKALDVPPESAREHHLHEEHDDLRVLDHLAEVLQDALARRPEVEADEEEHGGGRELQREVDVDLT